MAVASPTLATQDDEPKKVFVCKYVGTPGVDERLQTGDNPINPNANSIPGFVSIETVVGLEFADEHGQSIVIAVDNGQPEPDVSECPPARGPGEIVVDKVVTGDGASTTELFAITVTGQTGFNLSADADPKSFEVTDGGETSYTVAESLSAGQTTAGWSLTGIVCTSDDNGVLNSATFLVDFNEKITCVVTNAFEAPVIEPDTATIIVDKVVTGDDADAEEGFAISVTDQPDFDLSANDDAVSFEVEVDDTSYSVGETLTQEQLDAGWTLTSIVCTSGNNELDETDFSLEAEDTVSCLITNAFEAPAETGDIKVIKRLCTDIGENNTCNGRENEFDGWEIDFEVFADTDIEADPLGTITVTLDEGNGSQGQTTDDLGGILEAGETYTVCEVPVLRNPDTDEEVALIAIPRPDETTGGVNQSEHEDGPCIIVVLTPGTNVVQFLDLVDEEEEPATATIVVDKVVTGTDADEDEAFAVSVTGEDDFDLSANDDAASFEVVADDDTSYSVEETITQEQEDAGWTLTSIVCTSDKYVEVFGDDDDFPVGVDEVDETGFTLDADETVTCVITNAFEAPEADTATIMVDKVVTGTGASSSEPFTVSVTGEEDFELTASAEVMAFLIEFDDGTYAVDETITEDQAIAGWTLTSIVCTSDEYGEVDETEFTLEAGETVTCVITNAFQAPVTTGSITIVKDASPNAAQDFAYTVTSLDNFTLDDDADGTWPNSQTFSGLAPGSYAVIEVPVGGWTVTSITCSAGGAADATNNRQANITLVAGAHVTCTFLNTQDAVVLTPTLVIDKVASTETITITGAPGALVASPSVVTWTLTYTLTNGPVNGVVITDPVPAGFTFLDALNGGTLVGNTVTWNLGTLSASGSVSFRTTVDPTTVARALVTNTATIDSNETAPDNGQDGVTVSQTGTQGTTSTPAGTLSSTGLPNTAAAADAGLTAAAILGALMVLSAGVFVSAAMGGRRRLR